MRVKVTCTILYVDKFLGPGCNYFDFQKINIDSTSMIECLVRHKAKTLGIGQIDLQEDMQGTGLTSLEFQSRISIDFQLCGLQLYVVDQFFDVNPCLKWYKFIVLIREKTLQLCMTNETTKKNENNRLQPKTAY